MKRFLRSCIDLVIPAICDAPSETKIRSLSCLQLLASSAEVLSLSIGIPTSYSKMDYKATLDVRVTRLCSSL